MARKVLWQEMRRGEIEEAAKAGGVVIVPTGAIEQHGPHLPVNTDICDSWSIAQRTAERMESFPVLVAPPIWWGLSPFHMVHAGTITLRPETLLALVADVCTSIHAHGLAKIVLLNGHGSNFLQSASIKLAAEGVSVAVVDFWSLIPRELAAICQTDKGNIGHSGEMETSLQLYLQPHLVDRSQIGPHLIMPVDGRPCLQGVLGDGWVTPLVKRDYRQGVVGDPTVATAAKGEQISEAAITALTRYLEAYRAL